MIKALKHATSSFEIILTIFYNIGANVNFNMCYLGPKYIFIFTSIHCWKYIVQHPQWIEAYGASKSMLNVLSG
jgi:hypothetical protein